MALGIAAIPALTRGLGITTYGVWAVLISILSLTSVLQLGLAPAVTFHVAQAGGDGDVPKALLTTSFVLFSSLGALAGLALYFGAQPISMLVFGSADRAREAQSVLPLLAFAAWCQFLRQWIMAVEAGLQRYDVQAWAEGLGNIALYGGLAILATAGSGIVALAAWWGLASVGALFAHWRLWRRHASVAVTGNRAWEPRQARMLLSFGVRQWASQLGGTFFGQVDRVVVNLILGPSAAGIYSAGTAVAVRINELSAAPVQVVGPAMAADDGPGRRATLYRRAQALNALVAFGLAALVMLASEPLAQLLVPTHPETMASVLRIVGLCYGLYSVNAVAFFAAQGVGRPAINARWVTAAGSVFVLALVPLSRVFGTRGAAWANLAYALTLGINLEVLARLGLQRVPELVTGLKFLGSLALCFVVSATALSATEDPLAQVILATCTLAVSGMWLLLRFVRVAAHSSANAGLPA